MPAGTEFVGIEISHGIEVIETISAIRYKIDAAMIKGIELIKSKNT